MYPSLRPTQKTMSCFPRTRGDVPVPGDGRLHGGQFPPHTRGCTVQRGGDGHLLCVSPAHAGMYRCCAPRSSTNGRFPRTRGDVPISTDDLLTLTEFPPHTRGCTGMAWPSFTMVVVSPAHAGMYPGLGRDTSLSKSFPRTRGDVPIEKEEK